MSQQHSHDQQRALSAEGVSIGYGRAIVVRDLSFVIPRGVFTVLLGPNGSGKSTILRTLSGLLSPQHGAVLLDGLAIASLSSKEVARRIGVLSQGPTAPEGLTVRDLVQQGRYPHRSLFGRWTPQDDEACAEAMTLTGMDTFQDRPLDNLSGGERQRAWIAMALAQQTDILLLDEPTTFLDLAHQLEILDLIGDLVRERGKTVVAVLHDLNQAARYADHMVLLKAGNIVTTGRPADVMTASAIADVFGVDASIISDPVTGTPMCVPAGRQGRKGGNGNA
jgi:iron complex transport system ATP-binding protein